MRFLLGIIIALMGGIYGFSQRKFVNPERKPDAVRGSEFVKMVTDLSPEARDSVAFREITKGNMPGWLTKPVAITDLLEDAYGLLHEVTIFVLPDVLAVGDSTDFFRVPMLPITAQRIANFYKTVLPTRKISDLIHRHSSVKLTPHPMTPDHTMITVPVFARHDSIIESQRKEIGLPAGHLISGHKKDIAITNRNATEPDRLFIYGWHYPDGKAIQPLSAAHNLSHVDYSHGVRLVSNHVIVDGEETTLKKLLRDTVLYKLLSDEDGPMKRIGYYNPKDTSHLFVNPHQPAYYLNGGDKGLLSDLYTVLAKTASVTEDSVSGRVIIDFAISKDGIIDPVSIKVLRNRSVPEDYVNAAVEAIKNLGRFEPGKMNGVPKRVHYAIPVLYPIPLKHVMSDK